MSVLLLFSGAASSQSAYEKRCIKGAYEDRRVSPNPKMFMKFAKEYCNCEAYYRKNSLPVGGLNSTQFCTIEAMVHLTIAHIEIKPETAYRYCRKMFKKVLPREALRELDEIPEEVCNCAKKPIAKLYNDDLDDDEHDEQVTRIVSKCIKKVMH